jgi:hypothetical protein
MEVVKELLLWYCWDAVRRVPPQRFPIANVSLLLVEKFCLSVRIRECRRISLKEKGGTLHRQGTSSCKSVEAHGRIQRTSRKVMTRHFKDTASRPCAWQRKLQAKNKAPCQSATQATKINKKNHNNFSIFNSITSFKNLSIN